MTWPYLFSREDAAGNRVYPLYKSHFDSSMYDNGYMAHRAYSIIPLYQTENKKQKNYPDGEYEMKFEYELAAGTTYTVSYNLTIESNLPVLEKVEEVKEGGKDVYRFYYSDTNAALVNVNEKAYPVVKGSDGKLYADVPASALDTSKAIMVKSVDTSYGEETFFTHIGDEKMVQVYNSMMISGYDFNYTVDGAGTNDQTFVFDITKNGKSTSVSGSVTYRMLVPEGLDVNTLKVATVMADGSESNIKVNKVGDFIEFSAKVKTFHLTSDLLPGSVTLVSISVTGPTIKQYDVGATFDPTGLVVTANYSNGTSQVLDASQYTLSEPDMSTEGEKTVTVTYKDQTTTFTIKVGKEAKAGCGGSIVGCGSIMAMIAAFGITFISLKRKKAL